jgi:hypothetical protein
MQGFSLGKRGSLCFAPRPRFRTFGHGLGTAALTDTTTDAAAVRASDNNRVRGNASAREGCSTACQLNDEEAGGICFG